MNATQQQFRARKGGRSQCARILARLLETPGEWVAMPALSRIGSGKRNGSCIVHSRISDLRARGHEIKQWNRFEPGGVVHSFYKLVITPS